MSNNSTSMIEGWPDAIRCGSGVEEGAVFWLHAASSITSPPFYVQVYPNEYRHVVFNIDGSYRYREGHDLSSRGCEGKSIKQLYESGMAKDMLNSKTLEGSGTNTMELGWPDAIRCGVGTQDGAIFWLHSTDVREANLSFYFRVGDYQHRYVSFNPDGT